MNESPKSEKKPSMNLPNKLTVLRMLLVPVILILMIFPYSLVLNIVAAAVFGIASITDMLDGKIARKYHLITDFGKFMDPLADKFMVLAAIFGIICRGFTQENPVMFWFFMVMMIVTIFRELAVASIRLLTAKKANIVVAANMLGKIKTVSQIVCILLALLEPVIHEIISLFAPEFYLFPLYYNGFYGFTYLAAIVAIFYTIWSGANYLISYWKYLDPQM